MANKLTSICTFIVVATSLIISGCKTPEKIGTLKRFYFDFQNNKVVEDKTSPEKEAETPILRKAGKDIAIEIYNFNPLKYQIDIEKNSSDYFLADTGKFSTFIVIPKIAGLSDGETSKQQTLKANPDLTESAITIAGANSIPVLAKPKTDCDLIKAYMASLNLEKVNLENNILTINIL